MSDCSFERSVKWMYTVTGWGLEAAIFSRPSPYDGIAGCRSLLVLPVRFFLGERASPRCVSLCRLWLVGRSEAAGAVCFKV